ncbi:MAG: 4-hydroxybenzoate 3-monooxygenase, partial [Alphaproteobacteria bacterium]
LHSFPATDAFDRRILAAERDHLVHSPAAAAALAENYVGLPY